MRLYLIRHGNPNYQNDCLTDLGKKEAIALSKSLKDVEFDMIFSSSQGRAIETASYVAHPCNKEIVTFDWAREDAGECLLCDEDGVGCWMFSHPNYQALLRNEEVLKLKDDWYKHPEFNKFHVEEFLSYFKKSADEFLLSLGLKHDKEHSCYIKVKDTPNKIALFAHGGFSMNFLSHILDISYPMFTTTYAHLYTTGVVIIDFVERYGVIKPEITLYNDVSHYKLMN